MTKSSQKRIYNLEEIKIELSYQCNLNCVHCSSEGSMEQLESIAYEDCIQLVNDACKLGVKKISLSGGEPFLWPRLSELLDHVKTKNFKIRIYTSGTTSNFRNIVNTVKNSNLSFAFSLFSSTATLHDQITRVKGSFDKTIKSLRFVSTKYNSEIHFVPMSHNYFELRSIASLAKAIGIGRVSVLRFVPQGRGAGHSEYILNLDQHNKLKNDITKLRESGFNIRTGSPFNFLFLNSQPNCTSGMNKLIVAPDLTIYPCDAFKQVPSSRIVEDDNHSTLLTNSLSSCWKNSLYLNRIREILKSDFKEPCKSCAKLKSCRSGCLAQKVLINNVLENSADPACLLMVKENNVHGY